MPVRQPITRGVKERLLPSPHLATTLEKFQGVGTGLEELALNVDGVDASE